MSVRPTKREWFQRFPNGIPDAGPDVPETTAAKTMKTAEFQGACAEMEVKPTRRQAAAYNAGRGRWRNR